MSVLFFASDIMLPSVLWMRRMLLGLGRDVAILVTEAEPTLPSKGWDTVVLRQGPSAIGWKLARRLGLTASTRCSGRAIRGLLRALEDPRVEVALVHYLTSAVQYDRAWHRTSKTIYVHCHGYDVTWDLRSADDPSRHEHQRDYQERARCLPANVRFIANSRKTAERLRQIGLPEERISVKYLGVDVPRQCPIHGPTSQDDGMVVLYLGRLVDFKGPDLVIRAFDRACSLGLRGRLRIAGAGPMEQACRDISERSQFKERIELLGAVDAETGVRLRQEAHVFTAHNQTGPQTGQEEAFGVSLVEAMACALPVVTGRNGSTPELIEDGVEGCLVTPGDVEEHARALLRLGADPSLRQRMGMAGWKRARDQFSIERELVQLRGILGLTAGER
jgi:glycosyltransferase involved in cell wall biosynthesis